MVCVKEGGGGREKDLGLSLSSNYTSSPSLTPSHYFTISLTPSLSLFLSDPSDGEDWKPIADGFSYGTDLVRFIRDTFGDYFTICVAGEPLSLSHTQTHAHTHTHTHSHTPHCALHTHLSSLQNWSILFPIQATLMVTRTAPVTRRTSNI